MLLNMRFDIFFCFFISSRVLLFQNAQIAGDIGVANEQRRFASYASSDLRRFEEQRAALLG
jgi:hypothetical protein